MVTSRSLADGDAWTAQRRTISLTVVTFLFLVLCNSVRWFNVRYWGLGAEEFLDLDTTMKFVDCYETYGFQIYSVPNGTECSNYVYGISLVASANLFGVNHIPVRFLGFIFLAMLAYVIAYFLSSLRIRFPLAIVIMSIVVLSPPISLLAQRGNIDILIAFLIAVGIQGIQNGRASLGFVLIMLTVLLKFYTLPLLLFLLFDKRFRKPEYIVSASIVLLVTMVNFSLIAVLPSDGTYAAFGNRAVYYYLQHAELFSLNTPRILGDLTGFTLVIVAVLSLTVLGSHFKSVFKDLRAEKSLNVPNAFLIVGISCYMLGMSYDYRLIFLILPMMTIRIPSFRVSKALKAFLVLAVAYTSFNSMTFVQLIGDFLIGCIISLFLFLFLSSMSSQFEAKE